MTQTIIHNFTSEVTDKMKNIFLAYIKNYKEYIRTTYIYKKILCSRIGNSKKMRKK